MANTVVQFKRSTANDVPSVLAVGEPAYSFKSGKLFVGNTDGTIISIGGKYFVDQSNIVFGAANAAFANSNTNFTIFQVASNVANAAYANSNTNFTIFQVASNVANAAYANSNTNFTIFQVASNVANAGHLQANTARTLANNAYLQANDAYTRANTKFNSSGGTVSGTVTITGDLFVYGNTVSTNTSTLVIGDPLIYLAGNNYTTDAVDIGFVGNYVNATGQNVHTGLYREYVSKEYYLFQGYDKEPDNNHIDPNGNNFTIAVLNAAIRTSNLNLGGVNAISWLNATYTTANDAHLQANTARTHANISFGAANAAFANSNTNFTVLQVASNVANAAFANSNTNFTIFQVASNVANAAYANSNTNFTIFQVASNVANSGFLHANAAFLAANSAFLKANGSSNAENLTSGTIASARLSGSYTGITGLGTITVGLWQGGTVNVAYGGTGTTTFTTNGIIYGNSSGALKVTSAGTDGQVLLANPSGVPVFSMLDGGTF
jgi:hypothetical protein